MGKRKIVQIDEAKCDGCGQCVPSCAEGAIRIVDGKARLVSDVYCDGLGACLGHCPQDAIAVIEREAEAFDESAVHRHLAAQGGRAAGPSIGQQPIPAPSRCPGTATSVFALNIVPAAPGRRGAPPHPATGNGAAASGAPSALGHWPVQLQLVPPSAPFLGDADVILTAQCVPFAMANFHERLLGGRAVLIACPKLDNAQAHLDKLTAILTQSSLRSLTVVRMEVPCCMGLMRIAQVAIERSGSRVPLREAVVSTRGQVVRETLAANDDGR